MDNTPTMPKFVDTTGAEKAKAGGHPRWFWINSMGEYGHRWLDNEETIYGPINLKAAVEAAGLTWEHPVAVPQQVINDAERRAMDKELIHPVEYVVHRAWSHLFEMSSDLWRFYGEVEYVDDKPVTYGLTMSIEYSIENTLEADLRELAKVSGATLELVHEDFDSPKTRTQFGVEWDVRGKGIGEVAHIQAQWLINSERLVGDSLVSVL